MSGIIGYIGKNDCAEFLLTSIEKLKNRGKNNIGFAIKNDDKITSYVGKNLSDFDDLNIVDGFVGLAGVTDEQTITPCCNDTFGVAIDGRVRNRESLASTSSPFFEITTDEELLLSMLCENNENDKISVMKNICCDIKGDITFAFISNTQNAIYVKKGNAPLVIGVGDDGYYICSELLPLVEVCKKYVAPRDNSYIKITQNKITIYDQNGKKIKPKIKPIPKYEYADCGNSLLKCPSQIERICDMYTTKDSLDFSKIGFSKRTLERISRIILTANGEEYNIAETICTNMELLSDIETVSMSSNLLMGATGYIDKDTLVIGISNSGEDMPTVSAIKRAKRYGAKTIAVTNNNLSYLARICDGTITTFDCGVNAFQISYMALSMFAVYLGDKVGYMSDLHISLALKMAELLQGKLYSAIRNKQNIDIDNSKNIIVSGFSTDYGVAKEIATGLRKTCGINAFSVSLDEMPSYYNMVENSVVLVPVSTNADFDVVLDNLKKLCAISNPIVFTTDNIANDLSFCQNVITVGDTLPLFNPITIATAMKSAIENIQIDITKLIA